MMQSFVHWSLHPRVNVMPTAYSHRQFLAALRMLGAPLVLQLILEEVKQQTAAGSGSVIYDVACALVCAPDVTNDAESQPIGSGLLGGNVGAMAPGAVQRRMSLRDALKSEAETWNKIQKEDPVMAETVVRLYRKVEAQMAVQEPQPVVSVGLGLESAALPTGLDLESAATLDEAMVAAAAAAAGPGDGLALDTVNLGLGGSAGSLGLGSATNSAGGLDLSGDDMFSGLGALDGWDMT